MFYLAFNQEYNDARRAFFFTDCNFFLTSMSKNTSIGVLDYKFATKSQRLQDLKEWDLNSKI